MKTLARFILIICLLASSQLVRAESGAIAKFSYRSIAGVDAEKAVRACLPSEDATIRLERVPDSDVFHLTVLGADRNAAVKRADHLVLSLRDKLRSSSDTSNFLVLTRAEPVQ